MNVSISEETISEAITEMYRANGYGIAYLCAHRDDNGSWNTYVKVEAGDNWRFRDNTKNIVLFKLSDYNGHGNFLDQRLRMILNKGFYEIQDFWEGTDGSKYFTQLIKDKKMNEDEAFEKTSKKFPDDVFNNDEYKGELRQDLLDRITNFELDES